MPFEIQRQPGPFSDDFMNSIKAFLDSGNLTMRCNVSIYNEFTRFKNVMYQTNQGGGGVHLLEQERFIQRYVNLFESAKYHSGEALNQRAADILSKKSLLQDFRSYRHRRALNLLPSSYNHRTVPGAALAGWVGTGIVSRVRDAATVMRQVVESETRAEAGYKLALKLANASTKALFLLPLQAMGVGYLLKEIIANLDDLAQTEQQKRFAKTVRDEVDRLGEQPQEKDVNDFLEKYLSTTVIRTLFANMVELRKHIQDLQPWLSAKDEDIQNQINCNYVFDAVYAAEYIAGLHNQLQDNISLLLAVSKVFLKYIQATTATVEKALKQSAEQLGILSAAVNSEEHGQCHGCPRGRRRLRGGNIPEEKCCLLKNRSPERVQHSQNLLDMVETYFVDVDTGDHRRPRSASEIEAASYTSIHKQSAKLIPSYEPPKMSWRLRRKLGARYAPKVPAYINRNAFNVPTLNYPKGKVPQFINSSAVFGSLNPNASDVSNAPSSSSLDPDARDIASFSPGSSVDKDYVDIAEGWTDDGTTASGRD